MPANLKEVRERISSVSSTQQITKAMKMVSAAKLRRAQDAITKIRPYSDKLYAMLQNILSSLNAEELKLAFNKVRPVEKVLMVVVTSNRGLCGAFNNNIAKAAKEAVETKYAAQYAAKNVTVAFVGKKGFDVLKRELPNARLKTDDMELFSDLSFKNTAKVSQELMDLFLSGEYDVIEVAYAEFVNAASQEPIVKQFLPVADFNTSEEEKQEQNVDFIYTPDKETLLEELLPSILQIEFQKFLLDTHASEHGARMTAMENATENAESLKSDLKVLYNKARQEAITNEISEIVGGAAALEAS